MRQRQAAPWVHALPTVLVRWVRLFHSLPPDTTCCHSCHSPFSLHLCRMKQRQAAHWVHALPTVLGRWVRLFHSLPPAATPGTFMCCHGACGRVIRVCPIARMYASVTVLGRWFHSLPPADSPAATPGTFMCCHGACGRVIRVCPIARMYASVTVLGRWDRFHSLPPAATPGTFMCCHAAFMGVSFVCVPSPGCTRV